MVAKTIPHTLTGVELQTPVKTEDDSVADVQAYIDINTLNEFEPKALVYTQGYKFPKVRTKSVTNTLTLLDVEFKTLLNTLAEKTV